MGSNGIHGKQVEMESTRERKPTEKVVCNGTQRLMESSDVAAGGSTGGASGFVTEFFDGGLHFIEVLRL